MKKHQSWGQALRNIYKNVVDSFIEGMVHMAVEFIMQHTIMAGISAAWHAIQTGQQAVATGAQVGIHTAGEAAKTGATAAGAGARGGIGLLETVWHGIQTGLKVVIHAAGQIAMTAASLIGALIRHAMAFLEMQPFIILAGIEAAAAVAGIPIIGPILAPIAAGTTIATLEALAAFKDGGFVEGPGTGTSDSIHALLSNGEYVMPASAVEPDWGGHAYGDASRRQRAGSGTIERRRRGQWRCAQRHLFRHEQNGGRPESVGRAPEIRRRCHGPAHSQIQINIIMDKILFQVEMRVHFTAEHPKANEFEFGILQVWLFADNQPAAAEAAIKMVRLLPYKIFGAKSFPFDADAAHGHEIICAHKAANIGINFSADSLRQGDR